MPDIRVIVDKTVKLSEEAPRISLKRPLAYDNAYSHAIRVTVVQDDGTPEYLDGVDAVGSFVRADKKTVTPIMGTVSANVAEIVLPPSCYVVPGGIKCTLNLCQLASTDGVDAFDPEATYQVGDLVTYGGIVFRFVANHTGAWTGEDASIEAETARTALWVDGTVERNITTDLIDPGTPVGNIPQAIANATAAATSAAKAAASAFEAAGEAQAYSGSVAPAYAELVFPIAAYNQCCWYEGKFYVNTVTITTPEPWDSTHWEETDISTELSRCVHYNGDVAGVAEAKQYLGIT